MPKKERELCYFITKFDPSICCILDTHIGKARLEALAGILGSKILVLVAKQEVVGFVFLEQ
jgi:hypothetical protein